EALRRVELGFERLSALALLFECGPYASELFRQLLVAVPRLAQTIRERFVLGSRVHALAEQVKQQSGERGVLVVSQRRALDDLAEHSRRLVDVVKRRIRRAQQQREANRSLVGLAGAAEGEAPILLRQIGAERRTHAIAVADEVEQIACARRGALHGLDFRRRHLVALAARRDEGGEQKRCTSPTRCGRAPRSGSRRGSERLPSTQPPRYTHHGPPRIPWRSPGRARCL